MHNLPQVALHRLLQEGISIIKQNPDVLDDVFQYYNCEPMLELYGQAYIDQIKQWFLQTKIPVVQAWNLNLQRAPQIAIYLASEQEDETKAAIGDHFDEGDESNVGVGVFTVTLDIALLGSKNTDEVLWMHYIISYILFKRKRRAEELGLQLHTFTASDYSREARALPENVWSRTIRFRATVEQFWDSEPYINIDNIESIVDFESALTFEQAKSP
jgi:hypothetical protein